jgi:5-methyltetrahydrofolate--homocysteine methyltransferase
MSLIDCARNMIQLGDIQAAPCLLFDGALGTELIAAGADHDLPGDLQTLHAPARVRDIHRAYARAGARIHPTNTLNANRLRLDQLGCPEALIAINAQSVTLAREAAEEAARATGLTHHVAGALGPSGHVHASASRIVHAELASNYTEQATILAHAGVEVFLIETMYDLREALAALDGCRAASGDLPAIVTLAFTHTRRGFLTHVGDAAGDALKELVRAGADAVGSNCALDARTMAALAQPLRAFLPDTPLLLQPCAGQPIVRARGMEYPDTPEDFAEAMWPLVSLGIEMIGGCCGTTPRHIEELQHRIANHTPPAPT